MTINKNDLQINLEKIHDHRNDIDALRVFATILLIFFHTACLFAIYLQYHVKSQELSLEMLILVVFINIWYMPLFFLLAGMSTFYSLNFRTDRQYVKERLKRLFIPFILGITIIVPPLSYYSRLASWSDLRYRPINFNGSFLEYYPLFFVGGYFTWSHLWFLLYLFFISLVSLATFLKKENRNQGFSSMVEYYGKGRNIFLLALPMILINISLRWLFSGLGSFVWDWACIFFYLTIFIFGFLIVGDIRFEESIDRNKRLALILAIILSFIVIFWAISSLSGISNPSIIGYLLYWILFSLNSWFWLIAIYGYGRKYLNKQNSLISHFSEISLPFYILHHTVIIIIAFYVLQWEASILTKFLIISFSSLFITVLLCELVKTNNITRFIFGMKPKEKKTKLISNINKKIKI